MHMFRDQGGPPPFEPAGGPHPRKAGRGGGPPMRGPSPMFSAPPPPHMHDPRRIRRLVLCFSNLLQFALVFPEVITIQCKQFISKFQHSELRSTATEDPEQ